MKDLNIAIKDIIQQHGAEVIRDIRFVNILDDMRILIGSPAVRQVLREIIRLGYGAKLYAMYQANDPQWDDKVKSYVHTCVNLFGLSEDITFKLLYAITLALRPNIPTSLSTVVTKEEIASCTTDEYGAKYSSDGLKLLKGPEKRTTYEVKDGTIIICDHAFLYCGSLTSIVLPNSITSIGKRAFEYCESLRNIALPNGVTIIGDDAFWGCNSLTSIALQNSVTSIGSGAFAGCNCKITCNSPHFKVHDDALYTADMRTLIYCPTSKTSFIIPPGVTSIGDWAFSDCHSLTSIVLPHSVTSIGDSVFDNCRSLTGIALPNSVTSISNRTFSDCKSLTNIALPNSVTSIGGWAFSGCESLISISLPNSVTSIGDWAFSNCKSLTSIVIPESLTIIDDSVFENCESLTSITLSNNIKRIGNWAFYNCKSLISISLPNSVMRIGVFAFQGCSSLTSISLPNSVTHIDDCAFSDCRSLTSIYIPAGSYDKFAEMLPNSKKEFLVEK